MRNCLGNFLYSRENIEVPFSTYTESFLTGDVVLDIAELLRASWHLNSHIWSLQLIALYSDPYLKPTMVDRTSLLSWHHNLLRILLLCTSRTSTRVCLNIGGLIGHAMTAPYAFDVGPSKSLNSITRLLFFPWCDSCVDTCACPSLVFSYPGCVPDFLEKYSPLVCLKVCLPEKEVKRSPDVLELWETHHLLSHIDTLCLPRCPKGQSSPSDAKNKKMGISSGLLPESLGHKGCIVSMVKSWSTPTSSTGIGKGCKWTGVASLNGAPAWG